MGVDGLPDDPGLVVNDVSPGQREWRLHCSELLSHLRFFPEIASNSLSEVCTERSVRSDGRVKLFSSCSLSPAWTKYE